MHSVHRRPDLVAHVGQEFTLGAIGALGGIGCELQGIERTAGGTREMQQDECDEHDRVDVQADAQPVATRAFQLQARRGQMGSARHTISAKKPSNDRTSVRSSLRSTRKSSAGVHMSGTSNSSAPTIETCAMVLAASASTRPIEAAVENPRRNSAYGTRWPIVRSATMAAARLWPRNA